MIKTGIIMGVKRHYGGEDRPAIPGLGEKVAETVAVINGRTVLKPEIGLILGSGLGDLGDEIGRADGSFDPGDPTGPCTIPYRELPYFPRSTVPGHRGNLIIGRFPRSEGKTVFCMQGRFHYYEGYSMAEVTYPVRVMAAMGIRTLILTNAAGGLDFSFAPGDLMLVTDHINFTGSNPLIGPNAEDFGPRFPDMSKTYTPELAETAKQAAAVLGIPLREGVYLGCGGPSFETPAEIRLFRSFGASAVGMSTVPEAIAARHCGMKILALSCITNMAAGILDKPVTAEDVTETAGRVGDRFARLVTEIIKNI
ncbi:MAG: purine-nucleoside phosphorylase [Treponema sp.]|jgi:purine-nucleoside phosphorylase|nr:purine-nucleoside phosphorylase [Treponema sp.]